MSRMERKKLAVRTRILEAAEDLFLREDGYDKTTIREIAELADVSTGAVYTHFNSKPDIMAVLIEQILVSFEKKFVGAMSLPAAGITKIAEYIGYVFELSTQPKFVAYLRYTKRIAPEEIECKMADSLKKRGEKFFFLLRDTIRTGQEDGSIKKLGSPDLIAFTLLHVTGSFIRDITGKSLTDPLPHFPEFSGETALELLKRMLIFSLSEGPFPPEGSAVKSPQKGVR